MANQLNMAITDGGAPTHKWKVEIILLLNIFVGKQLLQNISDISFFESQIFCNKKFPDYGIYMYTVCTCMCSYK